MYDTKNAFLPFGASVEVTPLFKGTVFWIVWDVCMFFAEVYLSSTDSVWSRSIFDSLYVYNELDHGA